MDCFEQFSNLVAQLKVKDIQRQIQQDTLQDFQQIKAEICEKELKNETQELEQLETKLKYLKDQADNVYKLMVHEFQLKASRQINANMLKSSKELEEQQFCNLFQQTEKIIKYSQMFEKKLEQHFQQSKTSQAKKAKFIEIKETFKRLNKSAKVLELRSFYKSLNKLKTKIDVLSTENVDPNSPNKSFDLTQFMTTSLEPITEETEFSLTTKVSDETMQISQNKSDEVFKTPKIPEPASCGTKSKIYKRSNQSSGSKNQSKEPMKKRAKVSKEKTQIMVEPKGMETCTIDSSNQIGLSELAKTDSSTNLAEDELKDFDFDNFDFSNQKEMDFDFEGFENNDFSKNYDSFNLDFSMNQNPTPKEQQSDDFELDFDLDNF